MRNILVLIILAFAVSCVNKESIIGQTEITKWQYGKNAAISITYDDGTINQFRKALPIMNDLDMAGTFYINTGLIPGSEFEAKFIGRPTEEIIEETKNIPTNKENFFERASAIGFLGYQGTIDYHSQAGQLYESGKVEEAYAHIDEAYRKVIKGEFKPVSDIEADTATQEEITWEEIKEFADQGHEFGSHTISHPRLAVLDEVNMLYELEKSREDILNYLGSEHTFSAEGPYGTEDERVMEYAHKIYPSLRNRMPEPYLEELNRWHKMNPSSSNKEYVQWQRGPLSATPMPLMKSWIDSIAAGNNIWLVLVFHGVDGIGWEAKPSTALEEYFKYMKSKEEKLWIATFKDVTKYMRERMNSKIQTHQEDEKIMVDLNHSLDPKMYDLPLTLKTYIPDDWNKIQVIQGENTQEIDPLSDEKGNYILYQAFPNRETVEVLEVNQ